MLVQMCAFPGYFIFVKIGDLHDPHPELLPEPVLLLPLVNFKTYITSYLANMGVI